MTSSRVDAADAVEEAEAVERDARREDAEEEVLRGRFGAGAVAAAEEQQDVGRNRDQFQAEEQQRQVAGAADEHQAGDAIRTVPTNFGHERSSFCGRDDGEHEHAADDEREQPDVAPEQIDGQRAADGGRERRLRRSVGQNSDSYCPASARPAATTPAKPTAAPELLARQERAGDVDERRREDDDQLGNENANRYQRTRAISDVFGGDGVRRGGGCGGVRRRVTATARRHRASATRDGVSGFDGRRTRR